MDQFVPGQDRARVRGPLPDEPEVGGEAIILEEPGCAPEHGGQGEDRPRVHEVRTHALGERLGSRPRPDGSLA